MFTAIHQGEAERYAREFFRRDFETCRLGRTGLWQGELAAKLNLQNPVEPKVFGGLLKAITPDGDNWLAKPERADYRTQAWRFTLGQERKLGLLYGLSPEMVRGRLRLAHGEAVRTSLKDFEQTLSGASWLNRHSGTPDKQVVFAKFQSGASPARMPQLATTVFLFNLIYKRGGGVEEFKHPQLEKMLERTQAVYQQTLLKGVTQVLGGPVRLPDELYLNLHAAMSRGDPLPQIQPRQPVLEGKQLFAAWQEKAAKLGWGPDKLGRLLREAKLRPSLNNYMEQVGRFYRHEALDHKHSPRAIIEGMRRRAQEMELPRQKEETKAQQQEASKQEEKAQTQTQSAAEKPADQTKQAEEQKAQEQWHGHTH